MFNVDHLYKYIHSINNLKHCHMPDIACDTGHLCVSVESLPSYILYLLGRIRRSTLHAVICVITFITSALKD